MYCSVFNYCYNIWYKVHDYLKMTPCTLLVNRSRNGGTSFLRGVSKCIQKHNVATSLRGLI